MAPDTTMPQQSFDLIIRAYEPNILRLFTTMSGDEMTERDDMLQYHRHQWKASGDDQPQCPQP